MRTININNYNEKMGKLIDVQHPLDYIKKHDPRSINIYADKLIMNHSRLLNKDDTYYIICEKGRLSKRVVTTLTFYGYNVVQVKY
ncbi:MAG: rhodanese-like domain-containing protein [Firmicutes bacterium]|nr:rhodanese-like domain-containing protein [Bacillota bacterium]